MDANRQVKKMWETKSTEKDILDRPTKNWNKDVAEMLNNRSKLWKEARTVVAIVKRKGEVSSRRNSTQTQTSTSSEYKRMDYGYGVISVVSVGFKFERIVSISSITIFVFWYIV
ncbi:hypothetical protein Zmor_023298 [Zophobas morio]|uniref:Uncharacterized protein n=1 Tax=Zophobas morio TaxID=2755281 RepID=A0AA38I086_9CUCU|nr:hypothetical protein Zmor_023298 [Zophobas morio]